MDQHSMDMSAAAAAATAASSSSSDDEEERFARRDRDLGAWRERVTAYDFCVMFNIEERAHLERAFASFLRAVCLPYCLPLGDRAFQVTSHSLHSEL